MIVKIQVRRGLSSQWTSVNPILSSGEFGYEIDTGKLKIGDGITAWVDLEYTLNPEVIEQLVLDEISSQKGEPNGIAELDDSGNLKQFPFPVLTKAQIDNLITESLLVPYFKYVITDATSQSKRIIVTALTSNTLSKIVEYPDDNFDYVEYNYGTNQLLCYDELACVIRNTGGVWEYIDNSSHGKKKLASIENLGSNAARLFYVKTYTKVISLITAPDESYAAAMVVSGSSAGLSFADILLYRGSTIIGGYISFNGTSWSAVGTGIVSVTFSSSKLTITHNSIPGVIISGDTRDSNYLIQFGALGTTTTEVFFKDFAGTKIAVADTQMKFYFQRSFTITPELNTSPLVNSNIWVKGTMLLEI